LKVSNLAGGIGERLDFIRRAHSLAAQWLTPKKPGLYGMTDVLGLNPVINACIAQK
jgi:hypothetical protein